MRRFRRQHEQLRQVIIRVLRPSTKGRTGTPGQEEQEIKTEPVVDEAADANAIEVSYPLTLHPLFELYAPD
jgi:dynein heavy chain 1